MGGGLWMSSRNRADLRRPVNNRRVNMAVMGRWQQQTTFQVFDGRLEFDTAACGSTTGLIDDIRGRHGPSWARLPAQTEIQNDLSATPRRAPRPRRTIEQAASGDFLAFLRKKQMAAYAAILLRPGANKAD
jgi:hypothetical protein